MSEPLDEQLLAKILSGIRLEVRLPMRVRITKVVKGESQDSHELDVDSTDDVIEVQKRVISIARRWKGGFAIGTCYTVERIG